MKNKPFEKMTAAQKRVAIAEDVVAQIEAKRYVEFGGYLKVQSPINQASLASNPMCRVCAIGAATVSAIRLGNMFKSTADCPGADFCFDVVTAWFSKEQADLIEQAYETFGMNSGALNFYKKHPKNMDRMSAIFRNIITNKGEFKP